MNIEVLLRDPEVFPDEKVLQNVLGKGYTPFTLLLEIFQKHGIEWEWRYYKDGKAWLCKCTKKTKTIVWMSAADGYIRATIYLPEKHSAGMMNLNINDKLLEKFSNSKVGKSTACTFEIRTKAVLKDFKTLLEYKLTLK